MPELPEVENTCLTLLPHLLERQIITCDILYSGIIEQLPKENFKIRLDNSFFQNISRRGKNLIMQLIKDNEIIYFTSHLGMSGAWLVINDLSELTHKLRKHTHIIIKLDNDKLLIYSDVRKFGEVRALTYDEFIKYKSIQEIGTEVFWENGFELFIQSILKKKYVDKPIKHVLLQKEVISGVGNIYACESLWYSKINPLRLVQDLNEVQLFKIFEEIKKIFLFSISVGGSSIKDYVDANGQKGHFQEYFCVYKQKECPTCKSKIINQKINKRATFFCNTCQK